MKRDLIHGFTLSEVLIALAIIGVVAALSLPPLLNSPQNTELNTAAKKAVSIASQAYKAATIDNGGGFGLFVLGSSSSQGVDKFNALKSQLKVINDCPYNSNAQGKCWSNSGVGLKNYYVTNCSKTSNDGTQFRNMSFTTADGMFWMLFTNSATTGYDWLFIDVNGDKKPNDWGKDVFIFQMRDLDIMPFTYACSGNLKHNDGTTVNIAEFSAPFQ